MLWECSGFGFVVSGEAAVHHDPAQGPHPPARQYGEAVDLGVSWYDVESGAVFDGLVLVAGVGPDFGDGGVGGCGAGQELFGGLVVADAGRG